MGYKEFNPFETKADDIDESIKKFWYGYTKKEEKSFDKIFDNCKNTKDLKKTFFEAAKIYHPDKGGDVFKMQKLNQMYQQAKKRLAMGFSVVTVSNDRKFADTFDF